MSNNLIFQYLIVDESVDSRGNIGVRERSEVYKEMAEISKKGFELYAKQIGCKHMFSTEPWLIRGHKNACATLFECLRIIYDPYFDQFDKIMFADCDIVPNTKKNIFEMSDKEVYGVLESDVTIDRGNPDAKGGYNTWDYDIEVRANLTEKFDMHDCPVVPVLGYEDSFRPSKIFIYNTGVLVWTKEARLKARKLFDPWQHWLHAKIMDIKNVIHHMSVVNDQPYISAQLMKHNFDVGLLPQEWNDTPVHYKEPMDWVNQKNGKKCYMLHFTGGDHKEKMIDWYKKGYYPIFKEAEWHEPSISV